MQQTGVDLGFLQDLMRIPSVSMDVENVNRAVDFTTRYAESRGLRCAVETNIEGRAIAWVANVEGKRPDVLLSAHLDVVPAQTPALFEPRVADGCLFGRGTSDCKGHVALDESAPHLVEFLERMRRAWPDRECGFHHLNSSTDARHIQRLGLPMLILGVDARGAHTPEEYVHIDSLGEYADLIAGYLMDYFGGKDTERK